MSMSDKTKVSTFSCNGKSSSTQSCLRARLAAAVGFFGLCSTNAVSCSCSACGASGGAEAAERKAVESVTECGARTSEEEEEENAEPAEGRETTAAPGS